MSRYDLTDVEWRVIEPLLPNKQAYRRRGGKQGPAHLHRLPNAQVSASSPAYRRDRLDRAVADAVELTRTKKSGEPERSDGGVGTVERLARARVHVPD